MRKLLLSALFLGWTLACLAPAAQAAPANDNFAAAAPLAVGADVSADNLGATVEPGEKAVTGGDVSGSCNTISEGPSCGTSVWYAFEPPSSGQYTLETCDGGTDLETALGVYTGTGVGSLTEKAHNQDTNGCAGGRFQTNSQVSFMATAATLYYVEVTGAYGDEGSFYLRAYAGAPQPRPTPDTGIVRQSSMINELNTFSAGPGATSGHRHSASFALSSAPGASFQCSLDGAPYGPCTTPISYDDLAPGTSHVLQARATLGGVTDPTPAIERFTIDTAPPDTSLLSGPTGDLASQKATWRVGGSERYDMGTIPCGLDGMASVQCDGGNSFENLCQGQHTFRAAALDTAGNSDPTPLTASINVTVGPPCAAPTIEASQPASAEANFATIFFKWDNRGAGANIHIEFGTSTSYGNETQDEGWVPYAASMISKHGLRYLTPGTVYHYRATITTPFGTATTPDQTFTTGAAKSPLPSVANGAPVVVGQHAVYLPATIESDTDFVYRALVTVGKPVTQAGALFRFSDILPGGGGPKAVGSQVVDLEPSTTYHYRMAAEQVTGNGYEALGPEGTFTTPPFPKAHFKLSRKNVKVGRLTRKTKLLPIKLHGLPAGTKVQAELRAGKKRARKSGKVKVSKLTLKVKLRRKFRQALLGKGKAKLKVTATPPGDTASSVSFTVKLQKPHKPRKKHH